MQKVLLKGAFAPPFTTMKNGPSELRSESAGNLNGKLKYLVPKADVKYNFEI